MAHEIWLADTQVRFRAGFHGLESIRLCGIMTWGMAVLSLLLHALLPRTQRDLQCSSCSRPQSLWLLS